MNAISSVSQGAAKKSGPSGRFILLSIMFAPAPFFMCFDGCSSGQLLLPPALAWLPVLTIFSFFSSQRFLWNVGFTIFFILIMFPLFRAIDASSMLTVKRFYKVSAYFLYWFVISFLWSLIPLDARQMWLGQHA